MEANLVASPPQPRSTEDAQELLTVLTRKCGHAPSLLQPAQELIHVLLDTINLGPGTAGKVRCLIAYAWAPYSSSLSVPAALLPATPYDCRTAGLKYGYVRIGC